MDDHTLTRRTMIASLGAGITAFALAPITAAARSAGIVAKRIPSTGEALPVIGMGTWITFNVGDDPKLRDHRTKILKAFFDGGGGLIDSSPMYGSAHDVVGYGLRKLSDTEHLFSADKIWTRDGRKTREQFDDIRRAWGEEKFDLMQVHNLLAWREHLPKLQEMKKQGLIRYVGITTSHGRRHGELEKVLKKEELDFVQLTYNMVDREVEKRLLPLAKERGIAVIANRPFRGGSLVDDVQKHPFPEWPKKEFDAVNWPQFLLKWIVSHPAMTCAIPATSQVIHMRENMGAARGRLPDAKMRKRMLSHLRSL